MKLHILQPAHVAKSYNDNGVLGLFLLFIGNSWLDNMLLWTNKKILAMGGKEVSAPKFRA
jgi:hypothetical protein